MTFDGGLLSSKEFNFNKDQSMRTAIQQIFCRFGYLTIWFSGMCSLHQNKFHFAPYGLISCSTYQSFAKMALYYGQEKGLACFKRKMRLAEMLKTLGNHHLALICINLVVNVVIWEGEISQFNSFFSELSIFCQNLLRTLKRHLAVMIISNGMLECSDLLLDHFKIEYQRIEELYKNVFDARFSDTHPYTMNGILTNF